LEVPNLAAIAQIGGFPAPEDALLRRGLDGLQAWIETRYTYAHWRSFVVLPVAQRLQVLPPIPYTDRLHAAVTALQPQLDDIRQALEAGDLDTARHDYQQLLWQRVQPLILYCIDFPPQSPKGRPEGSGYFRDKREFTRALKRAIRQVRSSGRTVTQPEVARMLLPSGTTTRQLQKWMDRYLIDWKDVIR